MGVADREIVSFLSLADSNIFLHSGVRFSLRQPHFISPRNDKAPKTVMVFGAFAEWFPQNRGQNQNAYASQLRQETMLLSNSLLMLWLRW